MSQSKPDGGPAFPHFTRHTIEHSGLVVDGTVPGMTLRDWFAGQALAGMLASLRESDAWLDQSGTEVAAQFAYLQADAMLAERSK